MDKILFLCIIYSTPPEDTSTVKSLCKIDYFGKNIKPFFYIWDNSINGFDTKFVHSIFPKNNLLINHIGKNERLSVIYNIVIESYKGLFDWIIILDDDSIIDDEYMDCVKKFISQSKINNDIKVAIPKIYNENVMISPGKIVGVRGAILPTISCGIVSKKNIVSMMSGTMISISGYEQLPKFDERLSFYGVDTKFFLDLDNSCYKKYVLPYTMEHKSALRDKSLPISEQYKRFDNLFKARKIIYEHIPYYKYRLFLYKCLFSIKYTLIRKNFVFLKLIFS
ncbi:hypothetical protein ABK730_09190 [Klebsiella indica]|uniref:hypothetical protein n=1 Tax=Klebsiella TaxID=570 RepID=UPI0037503BE4